MRQSQRLHDNRLQLLITRRPVVKIITTKNRQLIQIQPGTPNRTLRVTHAVREREQTPGAAAVGVQGLRQEGEVGLDGGEFGKGVGEGGVGGCRSQRGEGGKEDGEEAFGEHYSGFLGSDWGLFECLGVCG